MLLEAVTKGLRLMTTAELSLLNASMLNFAMDAPA